MPGGWGRRAVGKNDRKLEDDVLFKEIGGQLDASNFDYDQWQRTNKTGHKAALHNVLSSDKPSRTTQEDTHTVASGTSSVQGAWLGKRIPSASSSTCHGHGRRKETTTPKPSIDTTEQKRKAEAIKILQLRIKARKQTIDEYQLRQLELLEANMKLKGEIEKEEAVSHADVKKLLRKHERFRGGITTLNSQFLKDLQGAKDDLADTKKKLDLELQKKEKEVSEVDKALKEKKDELYVLLNFKDKDYPVRALEIAELQKEIKTLEMQNKREEDELIYIVESELKKISLKREERKSTTMGAVVQHVVDMMHPSLRDMASHNLVMQKEITFHKSQIEDLQSSIERLEKEVEKLLKDPTTNIRMMMFPEFYPGRPKCTPDMDVILDIPTQESLPI